MESSSSNSEERDLQQMQMEGNYIKNAWHGLQSSRNTLNFFRILEEYETFRVKIYHNLNQLQWQLERKILHSSNPKSCLKVLRTPFKEFFDSKEYLDELDKLIDERVLKYDVLRMKEKEVQAIKEIENALDARLVIEGTTLRACLVTEGVEMDDRLVVPTFIPTDDLIACLHKAMAFMSTVMASQFSSTNNQLRTSFNLRNQATIQDGRVTVQQVQGRQGNDADAKKMLVDMIASNIENDDIGTSYDNDTVSKNNSDITLDIPNMDPDRGKEEHDVNSEAQQANALLKNELEKYKEKEIHFAKDNTIESEYCKKIKLLNDEISYFKSQACEKYMTFAKENEKYDELQKAGQTDQTLRMSLPKEDNVYTGKQGLAFEN
ncbi:hypothetical protein Tco_0151349 [Tanacetum coccineum]